MTKKIVLNKDQVNEKFLHLYQKKYIPPKYSIYFGGSGSGKSFSVLDSLVYRCLIYSTFDIVIARKVGATLEKTVLDPLSKIINKRYKLEKDVDYTYSKKDLDYQFASGSRIRITGYDDPEKLKGIEGVNVFVLEETTDFTIDDLADIEDRGRSKIPNGHPWDDIKIICMFNPIFETHWIRSHFFEPGKDTSDEVYQYYPNKIFGDDIFILKTTWRDNKWYNGKYKNPETREREKKLNPRKYSVYCNGNFGVLGKLVYENNVKFIEFTPDQVYPMQKTAPAHGIDFGFNDPSAFGEAVLDKNGDIWITCEVGGTELRTSQFAGMIQDKYPNFPYLLIYADSSAKMTIADMKNDYGFYNIKPCVKGPGSILAGIEWLQDRTIYCNRKLTPNFASELESYQYEKDKRTGLYKPMPKDENNHFMDLLRYLSTQWRTAQWTFS
jgi:PBSX family phage terminase large subunit